LTFWSTIEGDPPGIPTLNGNFFLNINSSNKDSLKILNNTEVRICMEFGIA
jgi:hypothetical protein